MLGALALGAVLLLQSPSQPTVTLILRDGDRVVSVVEAERLLKSQDQRLQVAATLALGTLPGKPKCITWEQHVAEVTCWHCAPERVYVDCDTVKRPPVQAQTQPRLN